MRAYEAILRRSKAAWWLEDYDKLTICDKGRQVKISFRGDGPGFGVRSESESPGDAGLYLMPDVIDLIVEASEIGRESRGERRRWLDLDDKAAVNEFVTAKNAEAVAGSWLPVPEGTLAKVVGGRVPGGVELTAEQVVAILRASGVMK